MKLPALIIFTLINSICIAQIIDSKQFEVIEIPFVGNTYSLKDNPARDVNLVTIWRNEGKTFKVHGFFDGDGKGGFSGNQFKVRFCPTLAGTWTLERVTSNDPKLNHQKEGLSVNCSTSSHPGFWESDENSPGQRWFKRSDGSHPYFSGNTMYSYLSEYGPDGPTGGNITSDTEKSGEYFKKLRFSISGDLYPNPNEKPFLDHDGKPTDNGSFSHRPNPKWFRNRVDKAVNICYGKDVIADIIINGPDSENSRSILKAEENGGDNTPILKYIAARYGSYPNVWICLSNEYNIRIPKYTEAQVCTFGYKIREFLPYPTPVSVHANQQDWNPALNREVPWNTHVILQNKLKTLYAATDFAEKNYWKADAHKPVINDELAYQGEGDGWSEEDVIEAHLGAFLGASYGSSGYKSSNKLGHYFMGKFNVEEHNAADNLAWMTKNISENINFWKMEPTIYSYTGKITSGIFRSIDDSSRVLMWDRNEYVIGTNKSKQGIEARLPKGKWMVVQYDIIRKEKKILTETAEGVFLFDVPASRAVMTHFKKIGE